MSPGDIFEPGHLRIERLRLLLQLLATVALASCASTEQLQQNLDLSVTEKVRSALPVVATTRQKTIAEVDFEVVPNNGVRQSGKTTYQYQRDGLVLENRIDMHSPAPRDTSRVSACGLVVASSDAGFNSRGKSTGSVAVMAGGVATAVPTAGMDLRHRFVLASATVDQRMCNPSPGQTFNASLSLRAQKRMLAAVLSFNRFYDITANLSCAASADVRPAQEIHKDLTGNFIKVSCKVEPENEFLPATADYAYLVDFGLYLPLVVQVGPAETYRHTYKRIGFGADHQDAARK